MSPFQGFMDHRDTPWWFLLVLHWGCGSSWRASTTLRGLTWVLDIPQSIYAMSGLPLRRSSPGNTSSPNLFFSYRWKLNVECWKSSMWWHVDTLFNINFLKTEIQLLYSKRISRSATFYIYRVSRCHRLTDWFSKKRYNHLLRGVGSEERLVALIELSFFTKELPKINQFICTFAFAFGIKHKLPMLYQR